MIRAVVFDFGGVFTTEDRTRARLAEFDSLLGWPAGTLQYRLFSGEAWELASTGRISPEELWARTASDVQSRLPADFGGLKGDPFYLEDINQDMVALARGLRKHCRLALCSNALPGLADRLEAMPELGSLFEAIVISALVGLRKPDARIYHLTARKLKLPISDCLLVDDKERNAVAAEAAGMSAVVFRSTEQLEEALHSLLPGGCRT
jgi:putative hydrolase of the HAD superfamily